MIAVVQVGAGLWGRSWAELVASWRGSRLAALVDASAEARGWAEESLGTPTFPTLEAALERVPCEAVLLVSPPSTHGELAEAALAAGRHVVVEKPVTTDLASAVAIAEAAERHGRHAVVAQNYRFRRQPRALEKLLRAGTLGALRGVRISFRRDLRNAWISPGDWRGQMPHPLLLDMAIHHVDLLRAITRRDVVAVDARSWPAPDGPFRHDPTVTALLELAGGIDVSYDGSWAAPNGETSWNGDWELLGGHGRLTWTEGVDDPLAGAVRLESDGERPRRVPLPRLAVLDRLGVIAELRRAIRTGSEPEVSVRDNLRTLATMLALAPLVRRAPAGAGRGGLRRMTALVGLDVGTTGVKAIAVSPDGTVLATAEHGYPLSTPRPGWSEQDPEDWWRASEAALAEVSEGLEVAGIGLSGQMHGLVALDAADRVVRPAILWNDQRTAAECEEIEATIGLGRLIELTGNRALPGFTAPKLLWLRRHEPGAYAAVARVCLPKDYVRLRLTGEWAIDVADASGTLLLDVAGRRWSDEVLGALEIPAAWLPPVLESPALSGRVRPSNDQLRGTAVAAGAGDCAAAALGVGVDRPGPASIVLGTSGVVFAALPAYRPDERARVHVFCHAVPGAWHAMGVMLSAAGSLQWLHDVVAPDVPFDVLSTEAERWEPGAEGLLFLPYLQGERTPHADPAARGAFTGLQLRHDRGALVRAVLEGVAFGLRDSLDLLRGLGVDVSSARVSGGGARSDLWLRICASVLGMPIERTVADEGSAFGAALLGGVAGGVFGDVNEAVAATVRASDVVEPDDAWSAAYDELHARYTALYPALRPLEAT